MLVELSIEKFFLHLGSFQTAVGEKRYYFELGLVPFMGTTYIDVAHSIGVQNGVLHFFCLQGPNFDVLVIFFLF